jgi:YHS domain-containing protein
MNLKICCFAILGLTIVLFACKQKTAEVQSVAAFANQTDFVCGMKVQVDYTDTCHYQGKVYAFCSESCKEEFQSQPETFLSKAGSQ